MDMHFHYEIDLGLSLFVVASKQRVVDASLAAPASSNNEVILGDSAFPLLMVVSRPSRGLTNPKEALRLMPSSGVLPATRARSVEFRSVRAAGPSSEYPLSFGVLRMISSEVAFAMKLGAFSNSGETLRLDGIIC